MNLKLLDEGGRDMKIKKLRPLILVVLVTAVLFFKREEIQIISSIHTEKNEIKVPQQALIVDKTPLEAKANDENDKKTEMVDRYQNAAYALAEVLEKNNLHGDDLDAAFSKLGREKFLKSLPEEVRLGYLKLEDSLKDYQESIRKEDGVHQEFFNRYQTEIPIHLKNQREALKAVSLPVKVDSIIKELVKEDQLKNQDIEFILSECGRGNADCINKSFALLLESNHSLSDDQLKTIKEYL
jgi:hypothetical protein